MPSRAPCKTIRGALARAVAEARQSGRISSALEVQVLIADRLARVVDAAEDAELARVVEQFQRAVALLPLDEPKVPDGDEGEPAGPKPVDKRGRVLELLDGAPQVGDAAHA